MADYPMMTDRSYEYEPERAYQDACGALPLALDQLEKAVESASVMTENLSARLRDVLREEETRAQEGVAEAALKAVDPRSALAQRVDSIRRKVEALTARTAVLAERVDL